MYYQIKSALWLLLGFGVTLAACNSGSNVNKKMATAEDTLSYAIGVNFASSLKEQDVTEIDPDIMAMAIRDVFAEDSKLLIDELEANMAIQQYMQRKQSEMAAKEEAAASKNLEDAGAFLAENQNKPGIKVTESGLQYEVIEEGTGESPAEEDEVVVHYEGRLIDGTVFDSSIERGEPVTFGVGAVIPGWTEALTMMKPGAKWVIYLPPNLAYGARGAGQRIGPNSALIFDVELIEIVKD